MESTIQLQHVLHENKVRLLIKFSYDLKKIELVKTIADAKWSHTFKSWYISYYPSAIDHIKKTFAKSNDTFMVLNE